MLLFQDGLTHRWIAELGRDLDLIITLGDATGAICSALLVEQEGTMSGFLGLTETIVRLNPSASISARRSLVELLRYGPDSQSWYSVMIRLTTCLLEIGQFGKKAMQQVDDCMRSTGAAGKDRQSQARPRRPLPS
jgi:hypothetical protein